jgi:hypothetical protein
MDTGENIVAEYARNMVDPVVPVEEALVRVARLPVTTIDSDNAL